MLTGPPGCGKTAVVEQIIDQLSGKKLVGFYTRELREGRQRVGFEAIGLGGDRGFPLAPPLPRPSPNQQSSTRSVLVIPPVVVVRCAAELGAHHHQRLVQRLLGLEVWQHARGHFVVVPPVVVVDAGYAAELGAQDHRVCPGPPVSGPAAPWSGGLPDDNASPELVAKIETWLAGFSINDDLQKVRRQMADFIVKLLRKTQG